MTPAQTPHPPPVLQGEDLCYCYPGHQHPALNGATLSIPPACKVALVGRNGSGKSTLFLLCNGILRPQRGTVRIEGQALVYRHQAVQAVRRRVGIIFQNPDDQLFSASVAQDISFGPLNMGLSVAEARQRVEAAAAQCGVDGLLERPTHALSGGEKVRVALAGVLAMGPVVLLADEVMASLDPPMRRQIVSIFQGLVAQGKTVVLATHDMVMARRWADLVVVMDGGQVVATDTPERIFADRDLLERAGLVDVWE